MNRRDALKSLAAVAAGGSLPAAGAVAATTYSFRVPCQYTHHTDIQCITLGKQVVQWLTPKWQQRYWSAEFSEQVRVEKRDIAILNANIKAQA